MRFTRKWKIAAVSGVSALALAAGGTAAYAGVTPAPADPSTDTPATVAPNFGYHPPKVQLRDWQFDLQQSDINALAVNDVEGVGAIPMNRWTDTQLSPNVDRFSRGGNSVTIWHDALPEPTVELDTCTINFDQNEGDFRILRGTGTGAGLRSVNGHFDLRGVISVRNVRVKHDRYGRSLATVCPLSFVSTRQILRDVLYNRPLPGAVTFNDFAVQGDAQVFRVPVRVKPYVSPTETVTEPAAG